MHDEPKPTYYNEPRPELAPFLPQEYTRVLELGCASGAFRQQLAKPCEYWGVEPDREAAEVARDVLDRVVARPWDTARNQLPDGYFDLLICNDVIEHLSDHEAFLREVRAKLTPEASVVGSIPNVRFFPVLHALLRARTWTYRSHGVLDRTHLRFFTETSFQQTVTACGYQIEQWAAINPLLREVVTARQWHLMEPLYELLFGKDIRFEQFAFRLRPGGFVQPTGASGAGTALTSGDC